MSQHPAACRGCPFDERGGVFIPPDKPNETTRLVVWGEAGGEQEALYRRGYVGPSGRLLRRALRVAGLRPGYQRQDDGRWTDEEVTFRNVVLCQPPGNHFPGQHVARECLRRHQLAFLAEDRHPWLITGGNALEALADSPVTTIFDTMGGSVPITDPDTDHWTGRWTGRWAIATLHPAYLLHKASAAEGTSQDHLFPHLVYAANKALAGPHPSIPRITVDVTPQDLARRWQQRSLSALTEGVFAIDIEGKPGEPPALTGLSWEENEALVVSGWSPALAATLRQMMDEAIPIPHNAAHDILELDRFGVPIPARIYDTINTAAIVDPSLKKGLQPQVLSHVPGSVTWKGLHSHKHGVDTQPPEVHLFREWWTRLLQSLDRRVPATPLHWYAFYNGLDVAWTLNLFRAHRQALGQRWDYYLVVNHPLEVPLLHLSKQGMMADPARMAHHHRACERLEQRASRVLQRAGEAYLVTEHECRQMDVAILEQERKDERAASGKRAKFSKAKEMTRARTRLKAAEKRIAEGFNGNSPQQRIGLLYDWFGLPTVQGSRSSNEEAVEELISRIERGTIRTVSSSATLDEVLAVLRAMRAASKWSTWRSNYLTLEDVA